ncbi:hypothetical protein Taro_028706 [Colocasia esculenta]|uniref:Uncharacterized protein n=1 Tax=Colocasia esculenta TaxID=4460 RepID=A0A843VR57_COLES|nr:hypothetical protein [Colocasia esculenta]
MQISCKVVSTLDQVMSTPCSKHKTKSCKTGQVVSTLVQFLGSFPTEPVTREAHPYLLPGEGDREILHPSSSGGSAPPAV